MAKYIFGFETKDNIEPYHIRIEHFDIPDNELKGLNEIEVTLFVVQPYLIDWVISHSSNKDYSVLEMGDYLTYGFQREERI